jgi:hypothetical protein
MKDELDEQIEIEADLQDDGLEAACNDCGAETWTRNRQKERQ